MSIDLLNIARTGIQASQAQLGVTSNNIANANTEGYNRQVATQASSQSQHLGNNFYGTGTYVSDVKRVYNEFAARELRIGQTSMSAAETSYSKLSELDQIYAQVGQMVPENLNNFFASINSVADLPSDLGIRSSSLSSAQQLANGLNQMQSQLDGQVKQTNSQIEAITTRINEIGKELGSLNVELMKSQDQDSQVLDKQGALILELSEYAQVNVIPLDTGAKSIMLGGSMMLVSGEVSMSMGMSAGDPYPNEPRINASIGDKTLNVDPSKLGGQLGALFSFRDDTLIPASTELGQLALGVADTFNGMQSKGIDLNGEVGSNIFTDINDPLMALSRVGAFSTNKGTATGVSVNIDDVGALSGGSYELSFISATNNYQLKDTQTGKVSPLVLSGSQLTGGAGFSINIASGAMADGDKFEIRPTAGGAAGLKVVMTDPKGIAAAGPTLTSATANSGNTAISLNSMDSSAGGFQGIGSSITFQLDTAANTYESFNAAGASLGTGAITNNNINAFGMDFDITRNGTATADSFTFDLSLAEGDNSNAVAMASLSNSKLMNNGTGTLTSVFENTKLDIGSQTKSAEVRVSSATAIYQQASNRVQSESGVNLDEEAANLMRFQQSYQASARIMTTAQTIFDTLFSSVR
ncbi:MULTISPECIES: flagellar hook-associated protein FlgK [Shewanella]|uniref:Flagellar hook-associated protein 1 n=1 Tax=Shewanella psychromarinicola TaxID=2487742 RepID=A0A3N4ED84_9GAMM|nr:flagellar hook-associated protein FlgK [Shewanella psychromarinicola]AZG36993.1 flagellar hook-associated protein FlgK [Shewanella psychromarinicola]MCL1081168.1 flagellar hook-associated protein FlgK [Shewanella psychromarinicola]RPA34847.1 flagellar hook-associated protein FlgK [Shewanella psychromarinicola]